MWILNETKICIIRIVMKWILRISLVPVTNSNWERQNNKKQIAEKNINWPDQMLKFTEMVNLSKNNRWYSFHEVQNIWWKKIRSIYYMRNKQPHLLASKFINEKSESNREWYIREYMMILFLNCNIVVSSWHNNKIYVRRKIWHSGHLKFKKKKSKHSNMHSNQKHCAFTKPVEEENIIFFIFN